MATVAWDQGQSKTLSIASSGTTTDVLNMGSLGKFDAYRIGIISPAALTGVVTVEVSLLEAGPFRTLQSDGVDINLTAAKAAVLNPMPFRYLRLVSGASEAAQRDFALIAHSGV